MFIFTELLNVLHGFQKKHSKILCWDHMFDHYVSQTGMRGKMLILNNFKNKETPRECLERTDKNNETSSSLQLTIT